jgi:hypothetical protein
MEFGFLPEGHAQFSRERLQPPETGIVAGGFVLGPRVSQADN